MAYKLCIIGILVVSFICLYCISYKYTSKTKDKNLSQVQAFEFRNNKEQCHGHFYLCSIRLLFQENKLYGNISFPANDIYDFSSIKKFTTSYFKTRPLPRNRDNHFPEVHLITRYMTKEYNETWFTRNLVNNIPKIRVVKLLCSLNPFDYFQYSVEYMGEQHGHPTKLLFVVNEKNLAAPNNYTLLSNFYGPVFWPNIHADINTPRTQAACVTVDYSKGKYSIECPILEAIFTINIVGCYLAPSIYNYKCKKNINDTWAIKTFTNYDVVKNGSALKLSETLTLNLKNCTTKDISKSRGFWMKLENVWHWTSGRCVYPFSFNQQKKECLSEKTIFSFGDSHTKYRTWALSMYHIMNGTQTTTGVVSHMNKALVAYTKTIENSPNPVVIFNAGHWSFAYTDAASYMSDFMDTFKILSSLRIKIPSIRLIWVETTAVSPNEYHFRWRTNSFMAAMNDWVNHHMNRIGVEVVHAFDISFPMRMQSKDGSHYFELLEDDVVLHKERVSVGGAIASVLINTICP